MTFTTPDNKLFFAHGTLQSTLYECKGISGGTLTGDKFSDFGDGTTYPPFIRTISGTLALSQPVMVRDSD